MKRVYTLITVISTMLSLSCISYAQEGEAQKRILVIREAKQHKETTAAVKAYLIDDVLEVTVIARMYATKPRIYNVIVVGPKLGRMSPTTRKTLVPTVEGEEPFPTTERGAFISFGERTKTKEAKGTLTEELLEFKLPPEKIRPGKKYQLWVRVESMQRGGEIEGFKFDLKDLPTLISK